MGLRPSCRSCRHCASPQGSDSGWCHLRRLAIHPDLASELWCHHWTARPPRLPLVGGKETATHGEGCGGGSPTCGLSQTHPDDQGVPSRQLSFEALLPHF